MAVGTLPRNSEAGISSRVRPIREDAPRAVCIQPPWHEGCEINPHINVATTRLKAGEHSRHIQGTSIGRACMCPVESKAFNHHAGSHVLFWIQRRQPGYEGCLRKTMHLKAKKKKKSVFRELTFLDGKTFPFFKKCPTDLFSRAHRPLQRVPSSQQAKM